MWRWLVIFEDENNVRCELVSDEGYYSRAEAFSNYLIDCDAITNYLRRIKCKLIVAELIIFDNEDVFKEN